MNTRATAHQASFVDPAADIRDEIAVASGVPEMPEKIWFHKTAAAVIDADRCIGCGGCIAACPSRSIGLGEDGRPTLILMCTGCSACWDYCPMGGLRTERLPDVLGLDSPAVSRSGTALAGGASAPAGVGVVVDSSSARATEPAENAQDGGVVTALLSALLEKGSIDGAIVNRPSGAFDGRPIIATTVEELRESAGSVYVQSHALTALNVGLSQDVGRLAFVGTPCQVSALRALQRFPWQYRQTAADSVVLTVALFCTRSFDGESLKAELAAAGVDVARLARTDVSAGEMIGWDDSGNELMRLPVRDVQAAALKGCGECADFTGLSADIAVGSIGSDPGWTTVLARTGAGRIALEEVASALDVRPVPNLDLVAQMADRDRMRAERAMQRDFDPAGHLWIGYPDHVAAYEGSTRAAAAPPAYRSQHYQVSC